MPNLETYKGSYLWKYVPNLPVAVVFAALFLILSIAHTWKMMKHQTWYCIPFIVGGYCESVGYACRALATYNTGSLTPFLLQAIFILLPPCLFAGTLYMVYSRIVRAVHGAQLSFISPKWSTRIFVLGDLLCLNIQSAGAGLLPHAELEQAGNGIIVAGLGLQVAIFAGFMWCCALFHRKFKQHVATTRKTVQISWEQTLRMLYATSVIISVRNVFRLVEFITGHDSYLFKNEWPMYIFDGAPMLVTMAGFYIRYPPQLSRRATDSMIELVSNEGTTTVTNAGLEHGNRLTR